MDKTKVRITVEAPADSLRSFREVKECYKIKSSWLKIIDPGYQRPGWYFAFNGVQPSQFVAVEVRDGAARIVPYRILNLKPLLQASKQERNTKLELFVGTDGMDRVRFKEGFTKS